MNVKSDCLVNQNLKTITRKLDVWRGLPFGQGCSEVVIDKVWRWTMGESNSRSSNANAVYYHYTNGPDKLKYTNRVTKRE